MSDDSEQVRSAIAAAEKAASSGDFELAGRHLREAAALQEALHGPVHPDLANTLNNLGVACEQSAQLDAAEAAYRRAYAIALEAFEPGHPFVVRSAENLRDFCAARGRPFDLPAPQPSARLPEVPETRAPVPVSASPPAEPAPPAPVAKAPVAPPPAPVATPPSPPVVTPPSMSRQPAAPAPSIRNTPRRSPALYGVAIVIVLLVAGAWWWSTVPDPVAPAPAASRSTSGPAPAPSSPLPTTPAPVDTPPPVSSAVAQASTEAGPPDAQIAQATQPAAPTASAAPIESVRNSDAVAAALLCRVFTPSGPEWGCEPAGADITSGQALVYYTRVRSPRDTTIEHVWYRDDVLHQRVGLDIVANPGAGYRTYSRTTASAGDWRVELRSGDVLLDEQRFTVR